MDSLFVGRDSLLADSLMTKAGKIDMPTFSEMIVQVVVALGLIIVLLYLTVYIFKKISGHGKFVHKMDKNAGILDIFPLTPKQAIYIIQLMDEILILGVSENSINLLDKITDREKISEIRERLNKKDELKFKNIFKRLTKNG